MGSSGRRLVISGCRVKRGFFFLGDGRVHLLQSAGQVGFNYSDVIFIHAGSRGPKYLFIGSRAIVVAQVSSVLPSLLAK